MLRLSYHCPRRQKWKRSQPIRQLFRRGALLVLLPQRFRALLRSMPVLVRSAVEQLRAGQRYYVPQALRRLRLARLPQPTVPQLLSAGLLMLDSNSRCCWQKE